MNMTTKHFLHRGEQLTEDINIKYGNSEKFFSYVDGLCHPNMALSSSSWRRRKSDDVLADGGGLVEIEKPSNLAGWLENLPIPNFN